MCTFQKCSTDIASAWGNISNVMSQITIFFVLILAAIWYCMMSVCDMKIAWKRCTTWKINEIYKFSCVPSIAIQLKLVFILSVCYAYRAAKRRQTVHTLFLFAFPIGLSFAWMDMYMVGARTACQSVRARTITHAFCQLAYSMCRVESGW